MANGRWLSRSINSAVNTRSGDTYSSLSWPACMRL
ncbi:Uncharacterised protein [Vibrio cholerae]|nr:Uncharacterised protein [Vibrio cholerae]